MGWFTDFVCALEGQRWCEMRWPWEVQMWGESGAQFLTSSLNIQAQVIEIEIYGKNVANDANLYSHLHVYIAIYNVNLISIL